MPQPTPDLRITNGHVVDQSTGLILPNHVNTSGTIKSNRKVPEALKSWLKAKGYFDESLFTGYYSGGMALRRDESTLIARIPEKGTVSAEMLMSALATGEIDNIGISPVVLPSLPSLIRRQQSQAQNSSIDLSGRMTPVKKARDAIARFNDSPIGYSAAVSEVVFNLRVFNLGCPIALVPLNYDVSVWAESGMEAAPILREGQTESSATEFYLAVDWEKVGTAVPYVLDPLRIRLSGIDTWPYWYRASDGTGHKWVLLHQSHVIGLTPGNSLKNSFLGTSSVWIMLGVLADYFLVLEEHIEKKIGTATNGILGISGVPNSGDDISSELQAAKDLRKEQGEFFASDMTILTSPNAKVNFTFLPLRQSDGVGEEMRKQHIEDVLAQSMGESLSAVVTRGGVGFGVSAPEAGRQSSDLGVNSILSVLGMALGSIYTRVSVHIHRDNDPSSALNIESFKEFGEGVKAANDALPDGESVLTRDELRALISANFFDIPKVEDDDSVIATATGDNTSEIDEGDSEGNDTDEDDTLSEEELQAEIDYYVIDTYCLDALAFYFEVCEHG